MKEEIIKNKIAEVLKGNYGCNRVWEAWQVGTMHQDDFYPLEECDEIIQDLYDIISKTDS